MKKEYINLQDMKAKFKSKSDLWIKMSVGCEYFERAYIICEHSLTFLS